jgi:lipoprotein LprG
MTQHARRPRARRRSTALRRAVPGVAAAVLVLAGCGGGSDDGPPPEDVMTEARAQLDETAGVQVSLTTDELPDGVDGVLEATGVGTHAPAFDGEITVLLSSVRASVPVVAVGGVVHAKLPFTKSYAEIDPAEYGAPDPAQLMATEGGISAWLTEATGLEEGEQTREGEAVLTSYSGTVPGAAVTSVIPSADRTADFDATFEVDDEGRLVEALVTGPFYGAAGDVAYTVSLSDYGTNEEITAP